MLHRKLRDCIPHGKVEIGLYGKIRSQKSKKQASSEVDKISLTKTATSTDPENTEGKEKCEGNACQALKNLSDGEEVELKCGFCIVLYCIQVFI